MAIDWSGIFNTGKNFLGGLLEKDSNGNSIASNLLSLYGAGYGLNKADDQTEIARHIIKNADPFADYRPTYAKQLSELMSNPSLITSDPGYQFFKDQGGESVQRAYGAKGFNGSGNLGVALDEYGQEYAKKAYYDKVQLLSHLGGADITPSPASSGASAFDTGLNTAFSSLGQGGYTLGRVGNAVVGGASTAFDILNKLGIGGNSNPGWAIEGLDNPFGTTDANGSAMFTGFDPATALSTIGGGSSIPGLSGGLGLLGGAGAAIDAGLAGTALAGMGGELAAATSAAAPGLTAALAGGGAEAAGATAATGGFGSTIISALGSIPVAGWIAAGLATAGAIIAKNTPASSPLNKFDVNIGGWTKGENFANTKFTADELNSYYGPAIKAFTESGGDISKAFAALKPPTTEHEKILASQGLYHLFGGTGNPFRQIAQKLNFGKGAWTASSKEKKALIDQLKAGSIAAGTKSTQPVTRAVM